MIQLGSKVQDVVSGYHGTVVARYEYLNGCVRYEVAGSDKDGKPEAFVFDEGQLVVSSAEPLRVAEPTPTGGPRGNRPVPR